MDEPTTSRIIIELAEALLDRGYIIYLENWYSSLDLLDSPC
jgi:hypothetical protein